MPVSSRREIDEDRAIRRQPPVSVGVSAPPQAVHPPDRAPVPSRLGATPRLVLYQRLANRATHGCHARLPRYTFCPNLVKFAVVYACLAAVTWVINVMTTPSPINYYVTFVWAAYLPIALVGLTGAYFVRRFKPSTYQGTVESLVIFAIPTIARYDVVPALTRVIASILTTAPANLTNFRIDLVLDEGAEATDHLRQRYRDEPGVRIVIVPAGYQLPNATRYKARAAQYLTELRTSEGESRDDIFVYHLDDDTSVGCDTIASIAEFIANDTGELHAAQGVLAFPRELAPNQFCWLADAVRPADDLCRFHFFTSLLGRPVAGFHGEHLLIRASIEAEIGWDFGESVKVEDAYFALTFAQRYPNRSAFLNSVSYGASPTTIGDLITQRRRWAAGVFGLAFDRQFSWASRIPLLFAIANWGSGLFQHVGVVLVAAYLLGQGSTSPVFHAVALIWAFNSAYILWMYLEGLRLNLDISHSRKGYVAHAVAIMVLLLGFSATEGWAAFLGFGDFVTGKQGFDVIAKRS